MTAEPITPKQLRAKAKRLYRKVDQLREQAVKLMLQADQLETKRDTAQLQVGMTVYLRSLPLSWLLSDVTPLTPLLIERLGPRYAVVSRLDGKEFPFPRRSYRLIKPERTNLRLTPL